MNDCSVAHRAKVLYGDGTDVPCQEVAPRAWFTFPGYGTTGNTVEGIVLCDQADDPDRTADRVSASGLPGALVHAGW
jgi:hypothetical protein